MTATNLAPRWWASRVHRIARPEPAPPPSPEAMLADLAACAAQVDDALALAAERLDRFTRMAAAIRRKTGRGPSTEAIDFQASASVSYALREFLPAVTRVRKPTFRKLVDIWSASIRTFQQRLAVTLAERDRAVRRTSQQETRL